MPELPEVETTCRGIAPHIEGHLIERVIVRERRLRWPVPRTLSAMLAGARVQRVSRRAKYLLVTLDRGTVLIHLGMSGSLRILREPKPAKAHDHLDFLFDDGLCLRYNDPRRFGSVHFIKGDPLRHRLLCDLGPEPLTADFDGQRLFDLSRGRRGAVKNFVMDQAIVVGVGNIYACEALFQAGIHPARQAGRVSHLRYTRLVDAVKETLASAIEAGGTTLRDFVGSDGKPGYFRQELQVYGRENEACLVCSGTIRRRVIGQRSTFFCATCQR